MSQPLPKITAEQEKELLRTTYGMLQLNNSINEYGRNNKGNRMGVIAIESIVNGYLQAVCEIVNVEPCNVVLTRIKNFNDQN